MPAFALQLSGGSHLFSVLNRWEGSEDLFRGIIAVPEIGPEHEVAAVITKRFFGRTDHDAEASVVR